MFALHFRHVNLVGRFNVHCIPLSVEPGGQTPARAHQFLTQWAGAHAHQHPLVGRPRPGDGMCLHVSPHLLINPVGRAAQSEFPQSRQIAGAKEGSGSSGRLWNVHLAFRQPLQ